MMKDLKLIMMSSISDVLEKMFYMSLEFINETGSELDFFSKRDDLVSCSLDFNGALEGIFFFRAPMTLLRSMASDFMGESHENISNDDITGIAKEVINMVAGNMFSRIDDTSEFNLGIPKIEQKIESLSKLIHGKKENLESVFAESLDGYLAFDMAVSG